RPRVEDPREHAALAAALLIGAQLLLGYWFYSYLTWCYPLLIIAMVQPRPVKEAQAGGAEDLGRGGERHLGLRAGQHLDPVDGEPGPFDGRAGVPAAVAAADEQWPDGGGKRLLD